MKKLTFGVLLCVVLVCCTFFAASAEQVSGSYAYTLLDDGTAQIVRYTGEEAELAIPDKLDGIAVTAIGPSAFHKNDTLQTVRIPEGVVSLGDFAFQRCSGLTGASLPASLAEVGLNPFAGCGALAAVEVASGNPALETENGQVLYSTGDNRLVWYSMLKDRGAYTVREGTRIIGASAFYECENLTGLTVRDSVTAIGRRAFFFCTGLKAVNLQDTEISTVGADAFCGCTRLEHIAFPEEMTSIAERAFEDCTSLSGLILPETITSIGEMAFRNCSGLRTVRLPASSAS